MRIYHYGKLLTSKSEDPVVLFLQDLSYQSAIVEIIKTDSNEEIVLFKFYLDQDKKPIIIDVKYPKEEIIKCQKQGDIKYCIGAYFSSVFTQAWTNCIVIEEEIAKSLVSQHDLSFIKSKFGDIYVNCLIKKVLGDLVQIVKF